MSTQHASTQPSQALDDAGIDARRWAWLPPVGSWRYYALLAGIGMFVLGPLGGVTAAYMNFALGTFVGGQVLAGILGSAITYGYGSQGKHGANYMQTTAASVAGMAAMGVLIQAMTWMGMPPIPTWQLFVYMLCIGMLGAGVGMLYTPILVDRLQLTYPSGLAVANILRALTDPRLLRQSISRLFGGTLAGFLGGFGSAKLPLLAALDISTSSIGVGLVTGARIAVPTVLAGAIGTALIPHFTQIGWLSPGAPFRKITFLIALGVILGAAIIDMSLIAWRTVRRVRAVAAGVHEAVPEETRTGPRPSMKRLALWVAFWATATVVSGVQFFNEPVLYMCVAVGLVFVFAMVNGISQGVSDQNPISSAFVVTVLVLSLLGLKDPMLGLMAATVLLVAVTVSSDMQQDRSTGWRLGSNRTLQFRFQIAGLAVGAVVAVGFAKLFMTAYPVLSMDQTLLTADQQPAGWTSAMTYKFVGALRSLTEPKPYQTTAILVGLVLGFCVELARKLIKANRGYRAFVASGRVGFSADFVLDALVLPSPYAFTFGWFVPLATSAWMALGGVISSLMNTLAASAKRDESEGLPSDMSSASLIGGGLIAGDALAALSLGIIGLLSVI